MTSILNAAGTLEDDDAAAPILDTPNDPGANPQASPEPDTQRPLSAAEVEAMYRLSLEWFPRFKERLDVFEEKLTNISEVADIMQSGTSVSGSDANAKSAEVRLVLGKQ